MSTTVRTKVTRGMSTQERFEVQTVKTETCWLWIGGMNAKGYGQFRVDGPKVYAHRWSFEQSGGVIPEGYQIDHLCRVHACVNPDHLEAVTPRENSMRGLSFVAENVLKVECPMGHPYSDSNTYVNPKGGRVCIECKRVKNREYKARRRYRLRPSP